MEINKKSFRNYVNDALIFIKQEFKKRDQRDIKKIVFENMEVYDINVDNNICIIVNSKQYNFYGPGSFLHLDIRWAK
jgi:uncharacterized protein YpuA (DUF1002 family)